MADRIIFQRESEQHWCGLLDGERIEIKGNAGHVYEQMLVSHPKVRVGFRSADMGLHTLLTFGPVTWMLTAEERRYV
jgi:hypothetical protein